MPLLFSDFQPPLERFACRFLVLVKGVGVDVQGGGWLGVTQQTGYRGYVCAIGNQKAGVAVPLRYNKDKSGNPLFARVSGFVLILFPLKTPLFSGV